MFGSTTSNMQLTRPWRTLATPSPPSFPDLQTAPIKSYQSKLTALLKTDSVDNFLESLTEYDLARITSAGAAGASWLTSPPDYN